MKENEKNIEMIGGGIVCDNTNCDYEDLTVKHEDLKSYLNKPCPKCGENLLTQEDLADVEKLDKIMDFLNTLSEEDLDMLSEIAEKSGFQLPGLTKEDLNRVKSGDRLNMIVKVHKGINIKDIKKYEE